MSIGCNAAWVERIPDVVQAFPEAFLQFENRVVEVFKNETAGNKFVLPRKFVAICLYNPYWNDFRIVNYFKKHQIETTLAELQKLRRIYGLDTGEAICKKLIRLVFDQGVVLNSHQIGFIEKVIPEFRDRDVQATQPGELLVYECLLGRGVKGIGRLYTHAFVDMCTGRIFGKVSRNRSSDVALDVLKSIVLPFYQANCCSLEVVLHSRHAVCEIQISLNELISRVHGEFGLQWESTTRYFGVMERFEKELLASSLFNCSPSECITMENLELGFDHWLRCYNANMFSCYRTGE